MSVFYPSGVAVLRVLLENYAQGAAVLGEVIALTVLSKSMRVKMGNYREADTFDLELDYRDFPFDPRAIRSCGVSLYVEDRKRLYKEDGSRNTISPSLENIIFQGFADEGQITLDQENRTVNLTGRDFTALLIDREYINPPINLARRVDVIFRDLLDELEETRPIRLNVQTDTIPILTGQDQGEDSSVKNPRKDRSYWDQIQSIAEQSGLLAYIALDELIVTQPRTLYDKDKVKAKMMVYGKNLKELSFERALGRMKPLNVRVISANLGDKEPEEVKIPEQASLAWADGMKLANKRLQIPVMSASGEAIEMKDAPFVTFRVENKDFKQLQNIGQGIYEQRVRQELEGKLTTKDMVFVDKENNFFKANKMRVGTPIEIAIDEGDMKGVAQLRKGSVLTQKQSIKTFLITRGYLASVAESLADSLTRFSTTFFTKEISFNLTEDEFSLEINFINYIELPQGTLD